MKWLLVLVVACGPAIPKDKEGIVENASTGLFGAFAHQDARAIGDYVKGPIQYGGLWFGDPDCMQKFPVARTITGDAALGEFTKCLTTLDLKPSTRVDPLFGVSVATYGPGLEVEISFAYDASRRPSIAFIGFAGRRDLMDGLPTVTPDSLEPLRIAGERQPVLDETIKTAIAAEAKGLAIEAADNSAFAWFKICLGADGNVTGVHARETTSPLMRDTYRAAIASWKFQPFMLGNQPAPVCTMVRFIFNEANPKSPETLPLPLFIDSEDDSLLHVGLDANMRALGETRVMPPDAEKTRMQRARVDRVEALVGICVDEQGAVFKTVTIEPSGLPGYDEKLLTALKQWRYKPLVISGKPYKTCTGVKFIYSQR